MQELLFTNIYFNCKNVNTINFDQSKKLIQMKHYFYLILTISSFFGWAQSGNLQGVISDKNGLTIPGATVSVRIG